MLFTATFLTSLSLIFASVSAHTTESITSKASSTVSTSTHNDSSSSPSSTVTTSPTATVTPSHPGQKNSKRGIAFASGGTPEDILNANQTDSVISWIYDWANLPPSYIAQSNLHYTPMQWGSGNVDRLAGTVSTQNADTLLAFNEPDLGSQSNIRPAEAAQLWMSFIEPLKGEGVKLGGPAITAAPSGKEWLAEFLIECKDCSIDFLPIHWYGSGSEGFYNYLWDIHTNYPKYPIWITEFADISTNDTVVWDFMNQTIHYLDSLDWVERYSWFGFFRPEEDIHYNMLREDGGLNELGELYMGAKTIHTSNRTSTPTEQYHTVSPGDDPNQPLITSWPTFNSTAISLSSFKYQTSILVASSFILGAFISLV